MSALCSSERTAVADTTLATDVYSPLQAIEIRVVDNLPSHVLNAAIKVEPQHCRH